MPQYEYQGINSSGRSLKGVIISDSVLAAKNQLRRDGIFPSQIVESVSTTNEAETRGQQFLAFFRRVPTEDMATMTRQLATLVSAHIPLVEALVALTDQVENPKLKASLAQVKSDVNEGAALSKALSRFPDLFSELFVNMVAAGESSGALDIVLQRLADFMEYQDRLRKKLGAALIYPVIMIFVGFTAVMLIFTLVIPQFEEIFKQNKQTLPLLTQIVLSLSHFVIGFWWAILLFIVAIVEAGRRFLKSDYGRKWWDAKVLRLPIFGDLVRMIAVSRFTKTLSTMLKSGIPLLMSLKVVKNVVENKTMQKAIDQATTDLTEGANIADPLRRSGQFPPLVTHMVSVGEKTGELENMLEKISEHYEYQVNNRIQSFTSLLEPIMIFMLTGMVLVIVLSVILPMLELNNIAL